MNTRLLAADEAGAVECAAELLVAGELVALPTETVYGLAGDAARPEAAAAIFQAKDRPLFDPLIVHLPGREWLERVAVVPEGQRGLVERLVGRFWPGPLTILLPRRVEAVPDLVTAGSELVAVRMSAHPVFQQVIGVFGRPLAAPSANRFGRISPTTGAHVLSELGGRVPLILDAGPTTHGLESTVVGLEGEGVLAVLRHGPVTAEMLGEFGRVVTKAEGVKPVAPGQMPGHYAPRTPLTLLPVTGWSVGRKGVPGGPKVGLLAFRRDRGGPEGVFDVVEYLSDGGDLREAATRLFAALRRLDEVGLERIFAEPVPRDGLGCAIMERLRRAAAGSGGG